MSVRGCEFRLLDGQGAGRVLPAREARVWCRRLGGLCQAELWLPAEFGDLKGATPGTQVTLTQAEALVGDFEVERVTSETAGPGVRVELRSRVLAELTRYWPVAEVGSVAGNAQTVAEAVVWLLAEYGELCADVEETGVPLRRLALHGGCDLVVVLDTLAEMAGAAWGDAGDGSGVFFQAGPDCVQAEAWLGQIETGSWERSGWPDCGRLAVVGDWDDASGWQRFHAFDGRTPGAHTHGQAAVLNTPGIVELADTEQLARAWFDGLRAERNRLVLELRDLPDLGLRPERGRVRVRDRDGLLVGDCRVWEVAYHLHSRIDAVMETGWVAPVAAVPGLSLAGCGRAELDGRDGWPEAVTVVRDLSCQ